MSMCYARFPVNNFKVEEIGSTPISTAKGARRRPCNGEMKQDKLVEIVMDIYREAFRKAEPSADFDKLMKDGTTGKDGWFLDYHLAPDIQDEMVERHIKKHKLSRIDARCIRHTVYLGCLPCSCEYKNVKHKRIDLK